MLNIDDETSKIKWVIFFFTAIGIFFYCIPTSTSQSMCIFVSTLVSLHRGFNLTVHDSFLEEFSIHLFHEKFEVVKFVTDIVSGFPFEAILLLYPLDDSICKSMC